MTERERLRGLISEAYDGCANRSTASIADYLLANGVIVVDMDVVNPKNRPLISQCMGRPLDEIIELVHAKDEGRIIVTPCKVGDTVYINGCFGGVAEPHKIKFLYLTHGKNGISIFFEADLLDEDGKTTGSDCAFWDHYIGEIVFLTREEAEAELQKKGARNERN